MSIFNTDKRIKLGIWGLGRGSSFISCANALNIDVVAGCDYNLHMRERFQKNLPNAFVTDNEDDFLASDIDAVLVATWFPAHAKDCIKALNAGKHVMCEVTSFATPGEGVQLVEAVEKSGKVYNLLENYPFMKVNQYAKKLWEQGIFGDFTYAEYDYNHDCRSLSYTYIDGVPVIPGYEAHNWRSWYNSHHYNTHSLGPVMQITGLRPESVVAYEVKEPLPGFIPTKDSARIGASLIHMSNGGVVRNLIGASSCDTHSKRIWGTRGFLDFTGNCYVRIGSSGHGRILNVKPEWPALGDLADTMGHGGGDFWELYYFAREILTGEKAPWDVYSASDVTIVGLMAARSSIAGGQPIAIPDFRKKEDRDRFRNDFDKPDHFDPKHIFPDGHDPAITSNFATVMSKFSNFSGNMGMVLLRNARDGMKLYHELAGDADRFAVITDVKNLIKALPDLATNCREAKKIMDAYPASPAAGAIRSTLETCDAEWVMDTDNAIKELQQWLIDIQ